MTPRDLTLLGAAMALVALGGIALFAQETHAVELVPHGVEPIAVVEGNLPTEPDEVPPPAGDVVPSTGMATVGTTGTIDASTTRKETAGWTHGIVKGDIQLAVSILDKIESISVSVAEARNPVANGKFVPAFHRVIPVQRGRGTPTFEVTDIPFSEYPYVVTVHSPGLNGTERRVTIDATTPYYDDILLSITPGAPLSILVRDQDNGAFPGIDVRLMPMGDPAGRPGLQGTADSFGSVVFDCVLRGEYQVFATSGSQSLIEAQTIVVQPGARSFGPKVQGQSHTLLVPRGVPVRVAVHDRAGYGIGDAKVVATKTDQIRLCMRELTTDLGGFADFEHLQPGVWQFSVTRQGCALWDCQRTLKSGQDPITIDVTLVPAR